MRTAYGVPCTIVKAMLVATTDPAGNVDMMQYDGIDRLTSSVHRLNGNTSYEYDKLSQLVKVTAPTGIVTSYEYDGIGRKIAEHSPDRGTTRYKYDLANNMVEKVTARDITETYSYDQLERPVSISYPNSHAGKNENVTYSYDNCTFGTGMLCSVQDESGTTTYSYDAFGNTTSMEHTELGVSYTTSYVWDKGEQDRADNPAQRQDSNLQQGQHKASKWYNHNSQWPKPEHSK